MHLGIEASKSNIVIACTTGTQNAFSVIDYKKIPIAGDDVLNMLDLKKTFDMLVKEQRVSKISLIEGGLESSKARVIIEYCIKEVASNNGIAVNTFAASHIKGLKEKSFLKATGKVFSDDYKSRGLHKYLENAFIVAWRFA